MDLARVERELFLCSTDTSECPRVQDLVLGATLLPLPILTNFVVVASPAAGGVALPLDAIAERPGFDINNRRFAAVKVTVGVANAAAADDVCRDSACERFCRDHFAQGLSASGLRSEVDDAAEALVAEDATATCLFFASGNMVCTGSSNPYAAIAAVHTTAKLIRRTVPGYHTPSCQIENIVASVQMFPLLQREAIVPRHKRKKTGAAIRRSMATGHVAGELNLQQIATHFELSASYEPDLFPGAIFRPPPAESDMCSMCFLLFPSGQCVITGAKQTALVYSKFRAFYIAVSKCILQSNPTCAYIDPRTRAELAAVAAPTQ